MTLPALVDLDLLLLAARLALAGVLAVAGLAKLADGNSLRTALAGFGAPDRLVGPAAMLLPPAELAAAVLLLPVGTARWGASLALALLVLFSAAVAWNLARGRRPDCRCFGQLGARPIGIATLGRNLALGTLAALVLWSGAGAAVNLAVLAAAFFLVQTWLIAQLLRQQGRLLGRIEALETRPVPAGAAVDAVAATPATAIPLTVGTRAPAFDADRLGGGTVSLDALVATGKPALLVFVDPSCRPCAELLPELADWRRAYADRMTITLVSRGTAAANAAKFGALDVGDVLLQREDEIADAYGVGATPMAVLVRPNGTIGSAPAERREGVEQLVRRVAAEPVPLLVGAPAPAFRLVDAEHRVVEGTELRGRPTLLLFWSPTCAHCRQLVPLLQAFEARQPADAPTLVLVTADAPDEVRALGLRAPVLLDPGAVARRAFGARGTPSAVLLDAEGLLAAPVVAGGRAVLALAGIAEPNRSAA